ELKPIDTRYPRRRQAMLKEWRATFDRPRGS
ncbi:MAG: transcriptional regulator, partial [Mesorhizobium sp.]